MPFDVSQFEILLDKELIACPLHRELFLQRWPDGFSLFTKLALEQWSALGELTELEEAADLQGTLRTLFAQKPLCCRLPKLDLRNIYYTINDQIGLWRYGNCTTCNHNAIGGQFRSHPEIGVQTDLPHACFNCVVYFLRSSERN